MRACDRIASLDQIAFARSDDAVDVRVYRGIDIRIHPGRGFDIGAAWYRGVPISWIAPAGEGGTDSTDWGSAWGGGLVTTCGLDNVGAPSEGFGLHGSYTFLRAEDVDVVRSRTGVRCAATILDPRGVRIERTIETAVGCGRFELRDRTLNLSGANVEAPLLYHVNVGWPVWDEGTRVSTDGVSVEPRDEESAAHSPWVAPAPTEGPERVWEHPGATVGSVENRSLGLRLSVSSNLPRLWQWIDPNPFYYAFALEPANCSVRGRAYDRSAGELPVLREGAVRDTSLVITVHEIEGSSRAFNA